MKTSLERTVEFEGEGELHSVNCDETYISIQQRIGERSYTLAISLEWYEWDQLVAEVERFRNLKSQSEAAA